MPIGDTTLLQRFYPEPLLKPGWNVKVEPIGKHGIFQVPEDQIVEPLLPVLVDVLPSDFTTTLAAFSETSPPNPEKRTVTELNMPKLTLAQYRILPADIGIAFSISQPGANFRYTNRAGAIEFDYGTVNGFIKSGLWSFIPEIWIFENATEPTLYARAMNYRSFAHARVWAFGFKYPLRKIPDQTSTGSAALTVRTEAVS